MRLENFLALTHATLVNEPCVNSFENITFEAHKIKRGDLFFAFDESEIDLAILNGAYGIVFDKPTQISDTEIAWIKVNDINSALKRLLRFKMIEKEVVVYECNEIVLKLALQVITNSDFIVLSGDLESIYKSLWYIESRTTILFCPSLNDRSIFTNIKELPKAAIEPIEIIEQTLFETSFIYDDVYYERQLISPFFMPFMEELFHLYKSLKIKFRLKKFTPIEHFEAVFTNKNFEIKNFGASDKVLIFEPSIDLIDTEIKFLKKQASWAKIIIIIPSTKKVEDDKSVFYYKDNTDIINILKSNSFHFALVVGVDKSILNQPIINQTQLTLNF